MKQRVPLRLAEWMLEHLTSGDRDEALAGDLREEFASGRTTGWYWRQVVAACVVSWRRTLSARVPLILFILVWCSLSPAWKAVCDRVLDSQTVSEAWPKWQGFWMFPAFALWLVCHSVFLWAGTLIYAGTHRAFGPAIRREGLTRALATAPLVFAPIYGATFVVMNLYWYSLPGLAGQRLASPPVEQITDLRLLADAIRLPYCVALLVAMWRAVPTWGRSVLRLADENDEWLAPSTESAPDLALNLPAARRFARWTIVGGFLNATIVVFILCRLPGAHSSSLTALLLRSSVYVVLAAVSGIGGMWFYWNGPWNSFRERSPLPFALFVLVCAGAWVWVPPMVIFSEQMSAAMCLMAMFGGYVLASGLRTSIPLFSPTSLRPIEAHFVSDELFVATLDRLHVEVHGYAIAIGLYAAGAALFVGANYIAAALFASVAAAFAWKRTVPIDGPDDLRNAYRKSTIRLAACLLAAILATAWALLDGMAHLARGSEFGIGSGNDAKRLARAHPAEAANALAGYESLILFPYPEKKQVVPPILYVDQLLAPGSKRPIVLLFNGVYRYVQPPETRPGRNVHHAQGTPLRTEISSTNRFPLMMDADQRLAGTVRLARCRAVEIDVENNDNRAGTIKLALMLTDGSSAHPRTLSLGERPILSTRPENFSMKAAPVMETLRFALPKDTFLRKFDEITVLVLPDDAHFFVAPKVAVVQFKLLPR